MKKQDFIKGSVILMISAVVSKVLGAVFKIPLTNMLGGVGMGFFSSAYSLFLPIYALTVTGLSSATARLTAQSTAFGMYKNARKVRKTALLLFSAVGFFGTFLILLTAEPFAVYIAKSPDAEIAVKFIAPSVFFGCITAVERGYCEGLCNMYPTAFSQLAEGIVKTAAGLFLCGAAISHKSEVMAFFPPETDFRAVCAAAGISGVTLSSVGAVIFFPIMRIFVRDKPKECDNTTFSTRHISRELVRIALPIGLSSLVTNFTSLIDLATIVGCIKTDGIQANGVAESELPQFIYGSFAGLAVTVFNLVPSVTNMLGKGILPSVTFAWEQNDRKSLQRSSSQAILTAFFLSLPAAVGIGVLSEEILNFLFPLQSDEVIFCVKPLKFLMLGMLCLCVSFPVFSMLQATGNSASPLKITLIGAIVKLIGNLTLIPLFSIGGAALSTTISYVVILALSILIYVRKTAVKLSLCDFLPIAYGGIFCGVSAAICRDRIPAFFSESMRLFIAAAVGGFFYFLVLFLTKKEKT